MNLGRTILKNLSVLAVARVITVGVAFVSTAYLARVLGPANYGILGFAAALISFYKWSVELGFNIYGTREIARDHGKIQLLVSHIVTMRFILFVVVVGIYGATIFLLDKPALVKTVLLVQGLYLAITAIGLDFVYNGVQRMSIIAVRQVTTSVASLAGIMLLVHRPEDVVVAAAIMVGSAGLNSLWLLTRYIRDFGAFRLSVDLTVWRTAVRASFPMAMSAFMVAIYYNMDIVMLGFLRTSEEAGLYVSAYRIHAAVIVPASLILTAFLPALSAAFRNVDVMRNRGAHYARIILVVGAPLAATGMAFSEDILLVVFGEEFVAADLALIILMANACVIYCNMLVGGPLLAWDRQLPYMYTIAGGAVVNIAMNLLLIPRFGIEGAAVATLSSEVTVLLGLSVIHFRCVRQLYVGLLARIVVCAVAAMSIVKLVVSELPGIDDVLVGLMVGTAAFFAIYAVLTVLIRVTTISEIVAFIRKPAKVG